MRTPEIIRSKNLLSKCAPTEEEEQKLLFRIIGKLLRIWPHLDTIFHIPNSGAGASRGQAGKMKAMGAKAGVSDIFYPAARDGYHGLWLELKSLRKNASLSEKQNEWLKRMKKEGFKTYICHGHKAALEAIVYYDTGAKIKGDMIIRLPTYCSIYGDAFADRMIKMCRRKKVNG